MRAFAKMLRPLDYDNGSRVTYRIPLVLARDLEVGDTVGGHAGGEYARVVMVARAPGFVWTPESNETYCSDAVYIVWEDREGRLTASPRHPDDTIRLTAEEIGRVQIEEAA